VNPVDAMNLSDRAKYMALLHTAVATADAEEAISVLVEAITIIEKYRPE